jgi:hypothetical protein
LGLGAGQISFPATQNPSSDVNTLDDYEEGTWTPTVGGTSTYSIQQGYYVKIGKLVYIQGKMVIDEIGTGDTQYVSGLPFTIQNTTSTGAGNIGYFDDLAISVYSLCILFVNNSDTFALSGMTGSATTTSLLPLAGFRDGTRIDFSGIYMSTS